MDSVFFGKKFLVTGASSGIGKATSLYLANRGASIVGVDMDGDGLELLKSEFVSNHCSFLPIVKNLRDEDLEDVFESATANGVKLDGMVHCAGISGVLPLKLLNRAALQKVMDINFCAFIELVRQYSKKKYSSGGAIVGISSLAAVLPRACELAYITSKAAMNAAIPCLAIELHSKNIRVNGIMPGIVKTSMITAQQSEEQRLFIENMEKRTLLGAAQPENIASVVAFLLSDGSKMITGRVIPVDGGLFL